MTNQMLDLSRDESLRLLAANRFGRLAVAMTDGSPVIRPVNYAFDEPSQSVVFRTSAGSKLHAVVQAAEAAFEIDGFDEHSRTGWSVIIHGVAEQVTDVTDIHRLDELGLTPWAPGPKRHWVRIRAGTVTGRRIVTGNGNQAADNPFRVLIVGGGVAGLEAALALHDLAGERVTTTLVAPAPEFVYRPMRVREPFAHAAAHRYPLDEITRDIGVELVQDAFKWLDPERRLLHTAGGEALEYDALLLAPGAKLRPGFEHALTLDDARLDDQLHGLIQDVEDGYVHKLAFLAPSPMAWPLPLYELALMTARRAYDMNVDLSITLATPEAAPLALFGAQASQAGERLLVDHGIVTLTSAHVDTPEPGVVSVHPGSRRLRVDRIVALPQLFGPHLAGVPTGSRRGFIPVDVHCRVPTLDRVYAAGDATDFAVKHGGIASQQADTAAEAIAALASARVEPKPFTPIVHGVLIGGDRPLYLSARITGGHGSTSEVSETPTWWPATKISAKYLAPYLESRERAALR